VQEAEECLEEANKSLQTTPARTSFENGDVRCLLTDNEKVCLMSWAQIIQVRCGMAGYHVQTQPAEQSTTTDVHSEGCQGL
jgi:hypothetical protein